MNSLTLEELNTVWDILVSCGPERVEEHCTECEFETILAKIDFEIEYWTAKRLGEWR